MSLTRPPIRRSWPLVAVTLLGVALIAPAAVADVSGTPIQRTNIDRPIPAGATLLPTGRLATPAGKLTDLGDFPVGLAISPDGVLSVAPGDGQGEGLNGGFGALCSDPTNAAECYIPPAEIGSPSTHAPDEALFVTNLKTGAETEVKATPTSYNPKKLNFNFFSMGVAFSPDGSALYAAGGGNDAVYKFPVTNDVVGTSPSQTAFLQNVGGKPTVSSSTYQSPSSGTAAGETKGLTLTPDGKTLLVLKEQSSELDVLNASTLALEQTVPLAGSLPVTASSSGVGTGVSYPYDVVVSPDGTHAYVSLQGTGMLMSYDITGGMLVPQTPALAGDHPTGEALSPDGKTLMVANANSDSVSIFNLTAGLPAAAASQTLTLHAVAGEAFGTTPDAIAFAHSGTRAYVALAGDDALAVLDLKGGTWSTTGFIPTGWYPTRVSVAPDGSIIVVNAKGLGSRYPVGGDYPAPTGSLNGPASVPLDYYYDANNMAGLQESISDPSSTTLAGDTTAVQTDLLWASAHGSAPDSAGPVPTSQATAGTSPITHVVYIVRENRTFDEVLGDQGTTRNDVDADPSLASFTSATPNAHSVFNRYATSDSYFSDGEASVQGHFWTTGAAVDDYVEKDWRQYYSSRNHSDDNLGAVSEAAGCTLFQSAAAKQAATGAAFTYFDFGEPVGATNATVSAQTSVGNLVPTGAPAAGALPAEAQNEAGKSCAAIPDAEIDPRGSVQGFSGDNRPLATDFLQASGLNDDGSPIVAGVNAGLTLRNFNYVELPGDHTTGFTAGDNTPRSEVARNDAGLGEIISGLSKSKYWSSTAVFVTEDDSQDGPDHVDGHRNVLLVASPYARQLSTNGCYNGYVSHVHYDQASLVRTIELILGLPPLSSYDQNAAPMYDLFQNVNSPSALTTADLAPYAVAAAPAFIDETVNSLPKTASNQQLQTESAALNLHGLDKAGPGLEQVIWQSAHPGTEEPLQLQAELAQSRQDATNGMPAGTDNDSSGIGFTETPLQQSAHPQLARYAAATADSCTAAGVAGQAPPAVGSTVASAKKTSAVTKKATAKGRVANPATAASGKGPRSTLATTGINVDELGLMGLIFIAVGLAGLSRRRRRSQQTPAYSADAGVPADAGFPSCS